MTAEPKPGPTPPDREEPQEFNLRLRLPSRPGHLPGAEAGIAPEELARRPSETGASTVTCIDYAPESVKSTEVTNLEAFLAGHRPEWSSIRWIDVGGLTDLRVIEALARKYHLHPLAVEDVLHVPQRPKCEAYAASGEYQARLFVVLRLVRAGERGLSEEQVSLFVGHRTVLTFRQGREGAGWGAVRQRLSFSGANIRSLDASYLAYALIDSIVDEWFPLLERLGDRLAELEELVLEKPGPDAVRSLHEVRRELLVLRHAAWPTREVIATLLREPHECLGEATKTYLRDVQDHIVQVIEMIDAYREVLGSLHDAAMTGMSNRMNEIMKVLTIVGTIFIPITFLAGVYGMNFRHMPELEMRWTYPAFWILCTSVSGGMLLWMKRRGWL